MMPDLPTNVDPAAGPTGTDLPPGVVTTFTGPAAGAIPAAAAAAAAAGRYHLLGEIARGGMGVVYRAHDPAIGRDVAVKLLHERLGGNPAAASRFLEEARITGQLQHPGIPAVHEIGELPDGRPFLAMKLIKGRTLADLLADPAAGYAAFIPVFEQVCQAVAYAHAHQVIHRDLKPANVMVGAFGEVQVMDWGLAKVLGPAGPEPTPADVSSVILPTAADEVHSVTQAGTVLGTPAYMPPEQAVGAIDQTDERADVFGLGAVLGFLLTRTPPYVADTGEATRLMAAMGQLDAAFARLDACGAEPELVALCKRCLAPVRADRPRDAGEVAAAVAAFRAEAEARARRAELDRVRADAERAAETVKAAAERKKRRAQLAFAGAAVLLVGLGGVGAWWGQKQIDARERIEADQANERALAASERAQRRERVRASVRDAIDRAAGFRGQWLWTQANDLLAQAAGQLGPYDDPALAADVAAARRDTAFVARLYQIRLDKAGTDGKYHNEKAPPAYVAAFQEHGYDVLGGDPTALAARLKASPVWPDLLAALDDWAWTASITPGLAAQAERVWAVTTAATGQSRRPGRQITDIRDPAGVMKLIETIPADQLTPSMFSFLSGKMEQLRGDKAAVLEAGIRRHPTDFWMHFELGWAYWYGKPQRLDLALGAFRTAVALRPDVPVARSFLAMTVQAKAAGKPPESESVAALRELAKKKLGNNPKDLDAWWKLGWALHGQKDFAGAADAFRELVRRKPDRAGSHHDLGVALRDAGRIPEALAAFQEALRLDPNTGYYYDSVGLMLQWLGRHQESTALLRKRLAIEPTDYAWSVVGINLSTMKDYSGAAAAYREAIRHNPFQAHFYRALAHNLWEMRDYEGCAAADREAVRLDPNNSFYHKCLGDVLFVLKDMPGSAAAHRRDGQLCREQRLYDHGVAAFRRALAATPTDATLHHEIALSHLQKNDLPAADAAARDAIRLDRTLAAAHATRGDIARLQRRHADALASFEMAVTFAPNDVNHRHSRAAALQNLGRLDEAIAGYRDVLRRDPNRERTHLNLGNLLRVKGDLGGAAEGYREVIRINAKLVEGYGNLAITRQRQGRLPEAVATWRKAVELVPNDALHKRQLELAERLLATEHALPAILAGTKQLPAVDAIAYAQHCLMARPGKYALAYRLYAGQTELTFPHAYNAACAAVLFAAGRDPAGGDISPDEGYYLMARAREWLAADLVELKKRLADPNPQRQASAKGNLRHHLADPDLTPVRDPAWLAAMPDPDERAEWERFWAGVRRLSDEVGPAWRERAPAPRPAK